MSLHVNRLAAAAAAALGTAIAVAGCSTLKTPDAQSIQGLTPSGSVAVSETFVAGVGEGSGTLYFSGQTYPFKLLGSVIGPGGAERINASGEVYKLAKVSDFGGRYTQSSGAAGLSQSGTGHLWLENSSGVIMHLYSQTQGVLLSMGKEEIFIRLNQ
jgi:hypothetical protein